jgi:GntR family transcriptional repressor for pyruvate dehydrogenase complex
MSDEVAGAIQSAISKGEIPPGARLPSENDMAADFNTGRGTVREALKSLESMGLIEIRTGSGTYVLEPPMNGGVLPERLKWLANRRDLVVEMLEVREVLQGQAARGFAKHADEHARLVLQQSLDSLETAISRRDTDEISEADSRLHLAVSEHCGNSMLGQLCAYVEDIYRTSNRALVDLRSVNTSQRLLDEHREIVHAALRGDVDGAESAMRRHISNVTSAIQELGTKGSA